MSGYFIFLLIIGLAGLFCITVAMCLAARWIEDKLDDEDDYRND